MSADMSLVDDLADVLSHMVVGWKPDLAQHPEVVRVMARYREWKIPCEAVIYHGPGHQSRTKCELRGRHDTHQVSLFGEHTGIYEWDSPIASADWGGTAREVVQCPNCKVLRDPDDTSPCRGYKCTQERRQEAQKN